MSATVRAGYKQTDIGIIPKDWETFALGEIATTSSGTTPARNLADRYYRNGAIHWVKTLDLNNSELECTNEQVTLVAVEETSLRPYPIGTVLVAMYGGFNQIGRTGLLRISAAVNQAITAIQPRASKLHSEYLLATLNFRVGYWKEVASSSRKDPNITSQDVRAFPISIPSLPEQRAIATALSDVDALLAKVDALVAKKRDLKKAAMQQLLTGQTRLPGFSGEWEMMRLGNCLLARPDYGINAPAVAYSDLLPTYVRITDITDDGRFSPEKLTSVASTNSPNYYLSEGDIVFARTGASVGKSYRYKLSDGELVFAGFLIRVRPDQRKLLPAFLTAYVATDAYWSWVRVMSMRSGQPGINGNEFAQLKLPVPTLEEQTAIATILSDMDAELVALEARRDKTCALKQGMMQELLTGRIRLV